MNSSATAAATVYSLLLSTRAGITWATGLETTVGSGSLSPRNPKSVQELLNWLYAGISLVGLLGNCIAIHVLTASKSIRRSNCYTLLVNQSLVDIFTCVCTLFWLLTERFVNRTNLSNSTWQWFMCTYVHSQFPLAAGVLISSYNLALLSLERMISILWPVVHRIHGNAKNQRRAAILIWLAGVALAAAYTTPTNGVTEQGGCYFWRKFPSQTNAKVFAVAFTFGYTFLPVTGMLVSYTLIYWRISRGGGGGSGGGGGGGAGGGRSASIGVTAAQTSNSNSKSIDIKLNVVKMLATCVLAYLGCHVLRATISIASRFGGRFSTSSPLYTISLTLLQANSAVNPFVYMFQYREYKKELRVQLRKLFGLSQKARVVPTTTSNS